MEDSITAAQNLLKGLGHPITKDSTKKLLEKHVWGQLRNANNEASKSTTAGEISHVRPPVGKKRKLEEVIVPQTTGTLEVTPESRTEPFEPNTIEALLEKQLWAPLRQAYLDEFGHEPTFLPKKCDEILDRIMGCDRVKDEMDNLRDLHDKEAPASSLLRKSPVEVEDMTDIKGSHEEATCNPKDRQTQDTKDVEIENESEVMEVNSELNAALHPETTGQPETTITPKDVLSSHTEIVPFNNGEWLPVIPEPERKMYWWKFPWCYKFNSKDDWHIHCGRPMAVWKLVAGARVTHLPEHLFNLMTPPLFYRCMYYQRPAPQIIDFGRKYEAVLEYFTERMLGINDYIPLMKRGLLNELFDLCGYDRSREIIDRNGLVPDLCPI